MKVIEDAETRVKGLAQAKRDIVMGFTDVHHDDKTRTIVGLLKTNMIPLTSTLLQSHQFHQFQADPKNHEKNGSASTSTNTTTNSSNSNNSTSSHSHSNSHVEEAGIFALSCRLNHACIPNARFVWREDLRKELVFAMRPIKEGEQITVR